MEGKKLYLSLFEQGVVEPEKEHARMNGEEKDLGDKIPSLA